MFYKDFYKDFYKEFFADVTVYFKHSISPPGL